MNIRNIAQQIIVVFLTLTFISISPVNANTYTYDDLNRVTSVSYDNGATINYTYDAAGNITSVISTGSTSPVAITRVSPGSGPIAGGTIVTITGAGFTGVNAVRFGGLDAINFTIDSDTSITATSPAASRSGTVDVIVATPEGSSSVNANDKFTYNTPITTPSVTVTGESDKDMAITSASPASITITVPSSVTDATLSVGSLINAPAGGVIITDPLPAINISTETTLGSVQLAVPSGATLSAPSGSNWDGTIHVPTVQANNTVTVPSEPGKTATVNSVIEIGFGDVPLTFNKAVRILIPGQAGKNVGYIRNGTFTQITNIMSADTQIAGDALADGGDGKIDVGSELVIWTKHFTPFITYTQNATPNSGGGSNSGCGGGGGGGALPAKPIVSSLGSAAIDPSVGGTVSLGNEASLIIPVGSLKGSSAIMVNISKVNSPPLVPFGFKCLGNVYDFRVGGSNTYSFNLPATLTLSLDQSILKNGEKAQIYYYDESSKKWIALGGTISGNTISVNVNHLTNFAVLIEETAIKPVINITDISGHWAENNIKRLVSLGVVCGYGDGSFKPNQTISRAEIATILVKAYRLPPQSGKVFTDTTDCWAKDYISTAYAAGIIKGYNDELFGPDDPVTREQMVVMIINAAKLGSENTQLYFKDSQDIDSWAVSSVASAVKHGITKGNPDNTFGPRQNATRAEAVRMILASKPPILNQ